MERSRHSWNFLLIGVGNELRGDDGVGRIIARMMRKKRIHGVQVIEAAGDMASLMEVWEGFTHVWLVDAVCSGSQAAGTLFRYDVSEAPLPHGIFRAFSTHTLGLAESIEMARILSCLPERVIIFGIEGAQFNQGAGLSPNVASACDDVVESLIKELRQVRYGTERSGT